MIKQVALIPSGTQPWARYVVGNCHNNFAYCSSLSVYVYSSASYELRKILNGPDSYIMSMCWSPFSQNALAVSYKDKSFHLWDLHRQRPYSKISLDRFFVQMEWCPSNSNIIGVIDDSNHMYLYNWRNQANVKSQFKPIITNQLCYFFAWNPAQSFCLACAGQERRIIIRFDETNTNSKLFNFSGILDERVYIKDMKWDPLSSNFLIVVLNNGEMGLFDTAQEGGEEMMRFDRENTGIAAVAWIPWEPGGFATASEKSGVVKLWNVSQKQPTTSIHIHATGMISLTFFASYIFRVEINDDQPDAQHKRSEGPPRAGHVKDSRIFCTFVDGAVSVYDLRGRFTCFETAAGHSDTVFACAFKPDDQNILATCSFDGAVRLWDVDTQQCIDFLQGNCGPLYSLCWGPSGTNKVATTAGGGKLCIFDLDKHNVQYKLLIHTEYNSLRCAWNMDPKRNVIASTNDGGLCCITNASTGETLVNIRHPEGVFGVDWSPFEPNVLATGCADGIIRIHAVGFKEGSDGQTAIPTGSSTRLVLKGHSERVFNVCWSPLVPGLLASGSDDKSVRVWDASSQTRYNSSVSDHPACVILRGHELRVRALRWSPAFEEILFSGSWDSTIRVWNVRNGTCLCVVRDHHADVYGIAFHPLRPFLMASCSRDNTIRLWHDELCSTLRTKILLGINGLTSQQSDYGGISFNINEIFGPQVSNDNAASNLINGALDYQHNFKIGKLLPEQKSTVQDTNQSSGLQSLPIKRTVVSRKSGISAPKRAKSSGKMIIKPDEQTDVEKSKTENPVSTQQSPQQTSDSSTTQIQQAPDNIFNALTVAQGSAESGPVGGPNRTILSTLRIRGQSAVAIRERLNNLKPGTISYYRAVCEVFYPPCGVVQMWDLVDQMLTTKQDPRQSKVTQNEQGSDTSSDSDIPSLTPSLLPPTLIYQNYLPKLFAIESKILSATRGRRFAVTQTLKKMDKPLAIVPSFQQAHSKLSAIERSKRQAQSILVSGDMKGYCEALVAMGEWDRALGVAPSVSIEYWQSLAERSARNSIVEAGGALERSLPLLIASGLVDGAIQLCIEQGQHPEAFAIAHTYSHLNVRPDSGLVIASEKHKNREEVAPSIPSLGVVSQQIEQKPEQLNEDLDKGTESCPVVLGKLETENVAKSMAVKYVDAGQPILAACCFLAAGICDRAVRILEKSGETELASLLSSTVKLPFSDQTHYQLALHCERLDLWDAALAILTDRVPPSVTTSRYKYSLCARYGWEHNNNDTKEFYRRAGLRSPEDYAACVSSGKGINEPFSVQQMLNQMITKDSASETTNSDPIQSPFQGSQSPSQSSTPSAKSSSSKINVEVFPPVVKETIHFEHLCSSFGPSLAPLTAAVLGQQPRLSSEIALWLLRKEMCSDAWEPSYLNDIVFWASSGHMSHGSVSDEMRNEILAYASYLGCIQASWRALTPVLAHLFNYTSSFIQRKKVNFLVPRDFRKLQAAIFTLVTAPPKAKEQLQVILGLIGQGDKPPSDKPKGTVGNHSLEDLARVIYDGIDDYPHPGIDTKNISIPLGSSIPSGGAVRAPIISHFTMQPINGPPFALSDGHAYVSMGEALMWAQVNPFSPLSNGERINPF